MYVCIQHGLFNNINMHLFMYTNLVNSVHQTAGELYISIFIKTQYEIIGVIYRPNTQPRADFDVFTPTLLELLEFYDHKHIECKLLGDFNISFFKLWSSSQDSNIC